MPDPGDRPSEIRRLFDLLVELGPEARNEELRKAGERDPALRSELEALLQADTARIEILGPLERAFQPDPSTIEDSRPPRTSPRYQMLERLGRGGMGVVYKARDLQLDRPVALKVLPPHRAGDTEAETRFRNEARAASSLDHPNICTIYDFDQTPDGHPFIAMAFLPGRTLLDLIREGPLPIARAVALALQVARGLEHAHERAVIHRDIKPANLMVSERGELRILDFGVARRGVSTQTESGTALGTLAYMSPEQLQGNPIDARTDLWSLGIVLFEMLAGRRPFQGETDGALWGAIVGHKVPPLSELRHDVPQALEAVVLRCLSKDPAGRYPDATTLANDLEALGGAPRGAPRRLPLPLSSFVGREAEQGAVADLLGRVRLVTLTGPPGVGKTRLATEVAPRAARGADLFFVALAGVSDPSLVIGAVAAALGVAEDRSRSAAEALAGFLASRRSLVVLDNFEQVAPAASEVAALLSACPSLRILVTSRVPLRVSGEYEFSVPPLPLPASGEVRGPQSLARYGATELFVRRAEAVAPRFLASEEDAAAVAQICERLEGLPLAIELAAARVKLFPPRTLLSRLGRCLDVLKGGGTDRPARHQTLRQAIDWSYGLLGAPEQKCFRRLGVFSGGFTLEAAEAVASDPGVDPIETLGALVDQSLVRRLETAGASPRYQMLEMIREYALEELEKAGEASAARRAHEAYFGALAETLEPKLSGDTQRGALEALELEHDNLRSALAGLVSAGRVPEALRLGAALWRFWVMRGHLREGRERLSSLLAHPDAQARTRERARVLHGAGTLIHEISDMESARPLLQESLAIWRELGDTRGTAGALASIGWVAIQQDDYGFGRACSAEALELSRRIADRRGEAVGLNNLGWAEVYQGDFRKAEELLRESRGLRGELGDRRGGLFAQTTLGWVLARRGAAQRAESLLRESLSGLRELGDLQLMAQAENILGVLLVDQDRPEEALAVLREGISRWRSVANKWGLSFGLRALAEAEISSGRSGPALAALEESERLWIAVGTRWGSAMVWRSRAGLRLAEHDWAGARKALREAMERSRGLGDRHGAAETAELWVRLHAAEAAWEEAARALGGADGLREASGAPRPPLSLRWLDPAMGEARTAMGLDRFEHVRAGAASLPPEVLLKQMLDLV